MIDITVVPLSVALAIAAPGPLRSGDDVDLRRDSLSFGGGASGPRLSLFDDPVNNRLGVACLRGATVEQLRALGIPDLDRRLDALRRGNDIEVRDGRCGLAYPAFVGVRRREMHAIVERKAKGLQPKVEKIARAVRNVVPGREEMTFHLLWSRVMDDVWDAAWHEALGGEAPPRRHLGHVSPASSGGGHELRHDNWRRVARHDMERAVRRPPRSRSATRIGPPPGGLGPEGRWGSSRPAALRAVRRGATVEGVRLCAGRTARPDAEGAHHRVRPCPSRRLRLPRLARRFDVPVHVMFAAVLHETAYELFDRMARAGTLEIPAVLSQGAPDAQTVRLVSLAKHNPPQVDDEAMDMFIRTDWRGNLETAAAFRTLLEKEPSNLRARLFLGFSLYEVGAYGEALKAFEGLVDAAAAKGDTSRRDWARVWMGHMHDLLGEREEAIAQYRVVLNTAPGEATDKAMFGQYGIGPTTTRAWAKERLEIPFTRR